MNLTYGQIRFQSLKSEIKSWLIYAGVMRAISSVGWTFCVYRAIDLSCNQLVFGLVFALTQIMYNHDYLRNYSQADDEMNMKERTEWISIHLRQLQILVIAAIVLLLFLLTIIPTALPPILAGAGFALGYTVKFLPTGKSPKQLPGLKAFYTASLWTVLIVWIPLAVAGISWNQNAILVAIACFCFVAALVNFNDIRDIEGDKLVGTITLAVLLGARGAKLASLMLAILGGCIAVWISSIPFFIVAAYIGILVITYNPEIERIRWHIPGGIVAGLAAFCI